MKKIFNIILCNILVGLLILSILEIGLFLNYKKNHPEIIYEIKEVKYNNVLEYYNPRPFQGTKYKKQPLIIGGCSFAFGQGLKNEETFDYRLSHITKRPVYNIALPGKGLQHNLYYVQNMLKDKNIQNPEYFIYVIMSDQIRRLYTPVCLHDFTGFPEYKLNKKNKLELKNDTYPFYKQLYVYYFFNNLYYSYVGYKNLEQHSKLVKEYLRERKEAIKEQYPKIKFVVLFYGDYDKYFNLSLDELEKEDFIFIHTQDISEINVFAEGYHLAPNDFHPSAKTWEILTPAFANELKL